jgi:hypothetical protein
LSAASSFTGGVILSGGTLRLADAAAAGSGGVTFQGAATLEIGAAGLAAAITGFAAGDVVDFTAIAPAALTVAAANGSTLIGGVSFAGSYATTGATPLLTTADGAGGTALTLACFTAGTSLLTPAGEIPVEDLRPGVRLATRTGLRPVIWVGRRRIDLARHPRPEPAMPIRIAAGAISPGVPHRPVRLSGDHALYLDGALVALRRLANGATIAREDRATVTYHHVELARHDIVLAEGLACESYLDTGNRTDFEGEAALALHPAPTATERPQAGCAPWLSEGDGLHARRARLLARALALGWRVAAEPALRIVARGRALPARDGGYDIPPGTVRLRLVSRSHVPQEIDPASTDCRRLGAALADLRFDGAAPDPGHFGTGFHPPEPAWRWTAGDAWLAVPAGARRLCLRVIPIGAYWVAPDDAEQARHDRGARAYLP